jgi:hypothetical protein
LSNGKNPSAENLLKNGHSHADGGESQRSEPQKLGLWQRRIVLSALLLAFVASFFVYARRSADFAGYAAVGQAFLDGRDIYLDTPVGTNTWPPFFSLAAVPLGLLDRASPYLARIVWIALTWASIIWALDLIARLIYGKRLKFRLKENSLAITSPELLVPFALTLPFIINNFELLQINMILFSLVLWGLYLQANGREAAGGIAIAAAAAMKVMAIAFLPYLLFRKRWRAAFSSSARLFFLAGQNFGVEWRCGPSRFAPVGVPETRINPSIPCGIAFWVTDIFRLWLPEHSCCL